MLAVALAAAAVACGPAQAHTIEASAHARVYAAGTRTFGCVRGKRPVVVGHRVTRVRLAGEFAVVVSSKALSLFDLRRRTGRRLDRGFATVRGLALTETGVAAWITDLPRRRRVLRDSFSRTVDAGRDIDPAFVHLAGSVLSWMKSGEVKLAGVPGSMPAGSLGHVAGVELAASEGKVSARYLQGRVVGLGSAAALRVAGSVVAARQTSQDATYVAAYDLVRGEQQRVCQTPRIPSYSVAPDGTVTCDTSRVAVTPVRYPCGPSKVGTFGMTDTARVYATGGRAYACRKGTATAIPLGLAAPVREARLTGGFTALLSTHGSGEALHVYSLATGRESGPGASSREFQSIVLSPAGVAVYIDDDRGVADTLGTSYAPADYQGGLHVAGGIVAWIPGKTPPYEIARLAHGAALPASDPDGVLLAPLAPHGSAIWAEHGRLVARLDGGTPTDIGGPDDVTAINAFASFAFTDGTGGPTRYDLATGAVLHPCPAPNYGQWC